MSVGLLLISHQNVAANLLETARQMLDTCPLATRALEVPLDYPVETVYQQAKDFITSLDTGNGVLILTDIYGATPSNIAKKIAEEYKYKLVAGMNLPMLVRILNYPQLNMNDMALKALSGGHDGILLCECAERK